MAVSPDAGAQARLRHLGSVLFLEPPVRPRLSHSGQAEIEGHPGPAPTDPPLAPREGEAPAPAALWPWLLGALFKGTRLGTSCRELGADIVTGGYFYALDSSLPWLLNS